MISRAQITLILLCISFPILVLFFRKSKKKKILIGLTILIFAHILFFSFLFDQKYYFSYEKFYNELRSITSANVLLEPQKVIAIGNDFNHYCMGWVSKLAKADLHSSDYYFLKLNKGSCESLDGTIVNDQTKEVIQFYFYTW